MAKKRQRWTKLDPSRTKTERMRFMAEMKRRFRALEKAVVELIVKEDAFGLEDRTTFQLGSGYQFEQGEPLIDNARQYAFLTNPQKVKQFQQWLQTQIDRGLLQVVGGVDGKPWTASYIESAWRKGMMRAYTDVRKQDLSKTPEWYRGTKEQWLRSAFLQPEMMSKVEMLATRAFEGMKGITASMSTQMSRILADGVSNGWGPMKVARQMTQAMESLSRGRALAIARTEIIHAHAEGQLDGYKALGIEEVDAEVEFSTAGDILVCFPAWTLVDTARGKVPIQHVCIGDRVKTSTGEHLVTALFARQTSFLVKVKTSQGVVYTTGNHPFWANNKEWKRADSLSFEDFLQSVTNEPIRVLGVVNVSLQQTQYFPALVLKVLGLLSVFRRISMPISTVNLNSNAFGSQQEIHRVTSDSSFLDKREANSFQSFSDTSFQTILPTESSVAGQRTEGRLLPAWCDAKYLATDLTCNTHRRTSTCLATVAHDDPSSDVGDVAGKELPTSFTGDKPSGAMFSSTCSRAVGESMLCGGSYLKILATAWARFRDKLFRSIGIIAPSGAVDPTLPKLGRISVNAFVADWASYLFTCLGAVCVALVRTKPMSTGRILNLRRKLKGFVALVTGKLKRHICYSLTILNVVYHRSFGIPYTVYNLAVESQQEYFANGILVHNCEQCSSLEGEVYRVSEAHGIIPVHPNCRCCWRPFVEKKGKRKK